MRTPTAVGVAIFIALPSLGAPPSVEQLVASIPPDAQAVASVDVAALRAHPLVQHWLVDGCAPWSGAGHDAATFLAEAGLDPVRDVDRLLVAVTPKANGNANVVVIAAGRYDAAALKEALAKRGAQRVVTGAGELLRLPAHEGDGAAGDVVIRVDDDLIVLGSEPAVTALAGPPGKGSPLVSDAIASGQLEVRAPFWMVVDLTETARAAMTRAQPRVNAPVAGLAASVMRASATVTRVAVSCHLDDALRIRSVALATSSENAGLLRDALKGALAAARLELQQAAPSLVESLRSVDVSVNGETVEVRGAIPIEVIDKLGASARGEEGRPQQGR
jgi:hypothetical protein